MLIPIVALWFFLVVGLVWMAWLARRVGRILNFRCMLLAYYLFVNVVSGLVHIAEVPGQSRGFFDAVAAGAEALEPAIYAALLGLVALCVGMSFGLPAAPETVSHPSLTKPDRVILIAMLLLITPPALLSYLFLQSYIASVGYVRGVAIDQGMARYVFLSNWVAWVISFAALVLLSLRLFRGTFAATSILALAAIGVIGTTAWSGGRTEGFVTLLPLLLVAGHRLRRARFWLIPIGSVVALSYAISVTNSRIGAAGNSSVYTWADWELGRFSMVGFAAKYVQENGYLLGETFFASLSNLFLGTLRLVGIPVANPDLKMMLDITGVSTLGQDATYVVAGYSAELFINFGYVGIVFGYLFLGYIAGIVDRNFVRSQSLVRQFMWAFVGANLLFRVVGSDSSAIGYFVVYSGLPVVLAGVVSSLAGRRPSVVEKSKPPSLYGHQPGR